MERWRDSDRGGGIGERWRVTALEDFADGMHAAAQKLAADVSHQLERRCEMHAVLERPVDRLAAVQQQQGTVIKQLQNATLGLGQRTAATEARLAAVEKLLTVRCREVQGRGGRQRTLHHAHLLTPA